MVGCARVPHAGQGESRWSYQREKKGAWGIFPCMPAQTFAAIDDDRDFFVGKRNNLKSR